METSYWKTKCFPPSMHCTTVLGPELVLILFLRFGQIEPACSNKVVLIKKKRVGDRIWEFLKTTIHN